MKSVQDCLTNNFISLSQVLSKMFTLLVNAWSMLETEENSFLKRGGNIFKEFIYNRKDFVKWRAYIYIFFFFLHPQTSNVTQAKLKLLYHECNNPGNYSIRQPFDIRVCRTNSFYFYFYFFHHWNVKTLVLVEENFVVENWEK